MSVPVQTAVHYRQHTKEKGLPAQAFSVSADAALIIAGQEIFAVADSVPPMLSL